MSAGQGSSWCSGPVLFIIKMPAIEPAGHRDGRWTEELDADKKLSKGFHWCLLTKKESKVWKSYVYTGASFYLFPPN